MKYLLIVICFLVGMIKVALASPPVNSVMNPCVANPYSPACNSYLQLETQPTSSSPDTWIYKEAKALALRLEGLGKNELPINATKQQIVNLVNTVIKPAWDSVINSDNRKYVKSVGFATSDDTYMAIYNCESPLEKHEIKFCNMSNSFIGSKTVTDKTVGLEIRRYNDGYAKNPGLKVRTLTEAFDPNLRPWYQYSLHFGAQDTPEFTGVYPNYYTGEPVFGYTVKIRVQNTEVVVLVLEYLKDSHAYE